MLPGITQGSISVPNEVSMIYLSYRTKRKILNYCVCSINSIKKSIVKKILNINMTTSPLLSSPDLNNVSSLKNFGFFIRSQTQLDILFWSHYFKIINHLYILRIFETSFVAWWLSQHFLCRNSLCNWLCVHCVPQSKKNGRSACN